MFASRRPKNYENIAHIDKKPVAELVRIYNGRTSPEVATDVPVPAKGEISAKNISPRRRATLSSSENEVLFRILVFPRAYGPFFTIAGQY